MKRFVLLMLVLLTSVIFVNAITTNADLGADFEWLNSIYVSLTTMALATYVIVQVVKNKLKSTKEYISIVIAFVVGIIVSTVGWLLQLGFLADRPFYSSLVYGVISTAIAAFGYDIIHAIKNSIISKDNQLNS